MCLKSGPPDLFLTLFSVNYVTDCVINMLSIWQIRHTTLKYQNYVLHLASKIPEKTRQESLSNLSQSKASEFFNCK